MSKQVPLQKQSVYDAITTQIVTAIENGVERCIMPWHSATVANTMPLNAATEMPYHGVNVLSLWATAAAKLFPSGYWASYQQWRKLGAQVRKGERGATVIFYKKLNKDDDTDAAAEDMPRFVLKHSHVFNFAQIDGWELPHGAQQPSHVLPNEQIAMFVEATKAKIVHGGSHACYRIGEDCIAMPAAEYFRGSPTRSPTEAYYAVLLHELTHWTGAPHRLDRLCAKRFGDREYAFEELVAELGAAFLCSAFKLVNEPRLDHAAYISSWLDILNRDHRAIFSAAAAAQQAVTFLRTIAGENG